MKPCPNPPKGQRCPLCGGTWVCLDWKKRKNTPAPQPPQPKKTP